MELKHPRPGRGERARFWAADDVGVELLAARYQTHRFVPHTHEQYSIGVILEGALGFRHERLDDVAPAGTVKAVDPGDLHTGFAASAAGWSYRNFFVDPDVMRRAARELDGDDRLPSFPREPIRDARSARELSRLHRLLDTSTDRLERESATLCALTHLISRHAVGRRSGRATTPNRPAVARARELIESRPGDDLSLGELASVAGLSAYHFLRVFRRETGLTPHAYLLQVRIDRARLMLAGGATIVDTALAWGFSDQSHLTRRFKAVLGVTPGQYQRRTGAGKGC